MQMEKKRLLAAILAAFILMSGLAACNKKAPDGDGDAGGAGTETELPQAPESGTVNVMSFTDEVPKIVEKYKANNGEEFVYEIETKIIGTADGAYQTALDLDLASNTPPDIYTADAGFALKYTQGDMSRYAATYKSLGITDVDNAVKEAEIAPFVTDVGTRDGEIVALTYQTTGGVFIYRRSIAQDVWGTDDPATIKTKIGPSWDTFFDSAETLKQKGYAIVSGMGDMWHAVENSSKEGWIVDGKLHIPAEREQFFDFAKRLKDNGYSNESNEWSEAWYADMKGAGSKQVFGFFGPAWLINYIMAGQTADTTFGDWAVCEPTVGFSWGGTWLMGHKDSKMKQPVGKVLEWITLDTTNTGLQYIWANGLFDADSTTKDTVSSNVVLARSTGKIDFLNGQDMFEVFVPASAVATGKNKHQYDETINNQWNDQVRMYTEGAKSKEDAIKDFKSAIKDLYNIDAE